MRRQNVGASFSPNMYAYVDVPCSAQTRRVNPYARATALPLVQSMQAGNSQLVAIREAARQLAVTPRTLKYYEELGLVIPARSNELNDDLEYLRRRLAGTPAEVLEGERLSARERRSASFGSGNGES
ncbi:MerR family DNA-binding transcriptional regulator [Paraburkholderia dipogonis]